VLSREEGKERRSREREGRKRNYTVGQKEKALAGKKALGSSAGRKRAEVTRKGERRERGDVGKNGGRTIPFMGNENRKGTFLNEKEIQKRGLLTTLMLCRKRHLLGKKEVTAP